MLNELYERYDSIIDRYPDVWKADIVGDSYMLVSNLTREVPDHVDQMIDLAIQLQMATGESCRWLQRTLRIRIGIHTGPVVAGEKYLMRYDAACESNETLCFCR